MFNLKSREAKFKLAQARPKILEKFVNLIQRMIANIEIVFFDFLKINFLDLLGL